MAQEVGIWRMVPCSAYGKDQHIYCIISLIYIKKIIFHVLISMFYMMYFEFMCLKFYLTKFLYVSIHYLSIFYLFLLHQL